MIRMVLSSFYNTLINEEDAIPASTMLEIDRIRNNKLLFVVSTNRLSKEVFYYNHDFPFVDYVISLNGSLVHDSNNNCIYKKQLEKRIIEEVEKKFNNIIYYSENDSHKRRNNVEEIYKLEIPIIKKEEIKKLSKLDASVSILKYNNNQYIEVTSNKTSIIKALDVIKKREKIRVNEIVSIIGNQSEKELIDVINKTYVASNSRKEFGKIKFNMTSSNNEKGVENIIKEII